MNVDGCIATGLELTWVLETPVESASILKCSCCASVLRITIPTPHATNINGMYKGKPLAAQGTESKRGALMTWIRYVSWFARHILLDWL
jgi:hypothetical protein